MATTTNLDPWNLIDPKNGRPATTEAAKRRAYAADRARALDVLGWSEDPTDRIVYTTGELWSIIRERGL